MGGSPMFFQQDTGGPPVPHSFRQMRFNHFGLSDNVLPKPRAQPFNEMLQLDLPGKFLVLQQSNLLIGDALRA